MTKCLTTADISRYATGTLSQADTAELRAHLDSCEQCRGELDLHCQSGTGLTHDTDVTLALPQSQADSTSPDRSADPDVTIDPVEVRRSTPDIQQKIAGTIAPTGSGDAGLVEKTPKIDGYQITGVLGQGGMGIVYRAVQMRLNRAVALKVLPALVGSANPDTVKRFRREASAAARLHHTHIVPVYDFGVSEDGYYYAMELIQGKPLDHLIKEFAAAAGKSATKARLNSLLHNTLPNESDVAVDSASGTASLDGSANTRSASRPMREPTYFRQVARWIADVADALDYAHSQQIIHRDIKPANLILSVDGRIMLTDFGLAKSGAEQSITMTGAVLGTLRYMSPEQAMARRVRVDHRTDVYSLGATLYELLCFQPTFLDQDYKALLGAILTRDPPRPRKIHSVIPIELDIICMKSLEKAPDARYETARAFAQDLRRYVNDLPITARKPSLAHRTLKLVKRRKAASLAIVALVLMLVAVDIAFRMHRRSLAEEMQKMAALANSFVAEGLRLQARPTPTHEGTRGKLLTAMEQFESALDIDAEHWRALANLAIAKKELFNLEPDPTLLEEANQLCDRALAVHSQSAALWISKGVILKKLERYEEATDAYRTAAAAAEDTDQAHVRVAAWDNLGVVQALAGNLDEAERSLEQAAELAGTQDPCNWHAWRNLAALRLFRRHPQTVANIEQALKCGPADPWAYLIRARVRLRSDDFPKASVDAQFADNIVSGNEPVVTRIRALTQLRSGHHIDAIEHARAAMKGGDYQTINRLIAALAAAKLGQHDTARTELAAAIASWPSDLADESGFRVRAEKGILWIETALERFQLRREVEQLLAESNQAP